MTRATQAHHDKPEVLTMLKRKTLTAIEHISGPGFVVWLRRDNKAPKFFVTWAETGVVELSPNSEDAWQYPTSTTANDNLLRALGPRIKDYDVRIVRASLATPQRCVETTPRQSDDDGGVIAYDTCEFHTQR
jgi:hypothetical protein